MRPQPNPNRHEFSPIGTNDLIAAAKGAASLCRFCGLPKGHWIHRTLWAEVTSRGGLELKRRKRQRAIGEGALRNLTDKEFEEMRYVWYLNPENDDDYAANSDGRTRKAWARDKAYDDMLERDEVQEVLENEDPRLWGT